jgi:DNA-binding CsgD family transcriptional regulator
LATGELQRIAPVAAARAEAAWLQGNVEQCLAAARVGFDLALEHDDPWVRGELGIWMWRAGGLSHPLAGAAEPFALQMAGDWQGAAALWARIGCPYERALAFIDGDEPALKRALALFEELGARPAANLVRQKLRHQGATDIPRGPRPATRQNAAGLTNRQLEVLLLMAEGFHNAEIASQLTTSLKTVDHHVAAILAKLEVHSRAQAIAVAYARGLLSQPR